MLHTCFLAAAASASASAAFGRPTMASEDRQMRDSEREPAREPTPGLDSWSFLDGEQRRGHRKAVAVDARGSLSFIQGLEAAHQQHVEEVKHPREPAVGWLSSLTQTFGLAKEEDEGEAADIAENAQTGGAERNGGAPNDHWADCASSEMENTAISKAGTYGSCACYGGEVRFGSETQGIWTQPVEMGDNAKVECSIDGFQKLRVMMPTHSGAERPRQCQCIERDLRLEALACTPDSDAGCATRAHASLLQAKRRGRSEPEDDPDPDDPYGAAKSDIGGDPERDGMLYANTQTDVCMWVPEADGSLLERNPGSLAETDTLSSAWASPGSEAHSMNQHLILKELATTIELERCDAESPTQVWTYLESTGQIRHASTGKCIGVYFDHKTGNGEPLLKAHDCNQNAETQYLIQRWELDGYTGDNFEAGKGVIRLAYGAHSGHPLCLDVINTEKLDIRTCASDSTKWLLLSDTGPHKYVKCNPQSAEEGMCACGGEIRFGDGEGGQFTDGVAVPNMLDFAGEVQCDLGLLRQIAIKDPVYVEDSRDAKARTCQCRGKKAGGPDGGGDWWEELSVWAWVGAGAGVLCLCGGVYLVREQRKRSAWASEFEEEYEEEYEEEGDEYEE